MRDLEETGLVAGIQDYSVHDGYGLRSLIFLKGCPLRCEWCQNPEAQTTSLDVVFHERLCIGCETCLEVCPTTAITKDSRINIDRNKCTQCGKCIKSCPSNALAQSGMIMSVEQVMKIILSYRPFYEGSFKGGVTLSGGEPLFQPEFVLSLLKRCKSEGIHTAMETCGYADFRTLRTVAGYLDLILYDIKHMDELTHIEGTGVSNKLILENLKRLCGDDVIAEIVVRIPLIPGFNDDKSNINRILKHLQSLGIRKADLLPFNDFPSAKYRALGKPWRYAGVARQSDCYLAEINEEAQYDQMTVTIGGLW